MVINAENHHACDIYLGRIEAVWEETERSMKKINQNLSFVNTSEVWAILVGVFL